MARQKPKRRKKKRGSRARSGGAGGGSHGGGGGVMQSMLSGFRRATGAEKSPGKRKGSGLLGNVIFILLIAAATAMVVSRYAN